MRKKIWWNYKKPTPEERAAITEEQVAIYSAKVIDRIMEKGLTTNDPDPEMSVIERITEFDPDTAPERPLTETDAARLFEGIDLRNHMTSTSPERFADLLLS